VGINTRLLADLAGGGLFRRFAGFDEPLRELPAVLRADADEHDLGRAPFPADDHAPGRYLRLRPHRFLTFRRWYSAPRAAGRHSLPRHFAAPRRIVNPTPGSRIAAVASCTAWAPARKKSPTCSA